MFEPTPAATFALLLPLRLKVIEPQHSMGPHLCVSYKSRVLGTAFDRAVTDISNQPRSSQQHFLKP